MIPGSNNLLSWLPEKVSHRVKANHNTTHHIPAQFTIGKSINLTSMDEIPWVECCGGYENIVR